MREQADGSRSNSVDDDSAAMKLDDGAVRQLRRIGLRTSSAPSPQGQHEAADHDSDHRGQPRGRPGEPEVPLVHQSDPGPITGDPDPIERSGRGALVLLIILAVIGVLLVGAIVAQFAGAFG